MAKVKKDGLMNLPKNDDCYHCDSKGYFINSQTSGYFSIMVSDTKKPCGHCNGTGKKQPVNYR